MELTDLPPQSAPLPWQADSWSRLGDALERDSFPHALLLAGSPGIGKTRLALALARRLLCHRPSAGINCGACQACELTRSGAHGDFRWLQPDADSRVIKIDQVRALVDFGHSTAGFGPRKVMVIAPADVMNTHAANALLKSLEEPPANTHLLLVCDRLHGVPPTIRSRCQILQLPLPPAAASLDWLDQMTGDRGTSEELLTLAGGRPLRAEALYHEDAGGDLAALRQALEALVQGRVSMPEVAAALGDIGVEAFLGECVDYCERHLRALDRAGLATAGPRAFHLLDGLRQLQGAVVAGANPNRQLLIENCLLRLHRELGAAAAGATMQRAVRGR